MTGSASRSTLAKATLWTLADFIADRGANFVIIIVLARLLSPAEFGTVALLAVFIALATLLTESGLGQALIQAEDISDTDTSTVFWLNLGIAGAAALALVLAAPIVAGFFDQPLLVPLMQILVLGVIFGAFGTVQRALLLRALEYRKLLIARVGATIIAGSLAIALAMQGFGVFALAWQACAMALVTSVLLWLLGRWRPRAVFDGAAAKRLFSFGGFMLGSSILETIYSRAYTLFIGTISSASVLGLYSRAEATITLAQGFVTYPINQIAFPALSRIADEREKIRSAMSSALKTAALLNFPALFGLAALAEPFLVTLYGDQWAGAAPFIQILCLGGVLMPLHILNLQALMAVGRADLFFALEVAKKATGIAILVYSSQWGAIGIAWGVVAAGFVAVFINTSLSGKNFGYGVLAQMRDLIPGLTLGLCAATAAYAITTLSPVAEMAMVAKLIFGSLAGAGVWAVLTFGLNLGGARHMVRAILRKAAG